MNEEKKRCEFCGYDTNEAAIMEHHQRFIVISTKKHKVKWFEDIGEKPDIHYLCANCHYILHRIIERKKKQEVDE